MSGPANKKKSDAAILAAIRRASEAEDIERFAAMGDDEVDAELRGAGLDPAAVRAQGEALGERLAERRERLAWKEKAGDDLARARSIAESVRASRPRLPRGEMIARLAAARTDPRFGGQVAAMFRKRAAEESTDDELAQMLEEIEVLARLGGNDGK